MAAWNPWRALRERRHITLVWADLPPGMRGAWLRHPSRTEIVLSASSSRIERNAGLAHELVHDERGIDLTPACPPAVRAKEEAIVRAITADRLVPLADLMELVEASTSIGVPVDAALVAREFEVPLDVAQTALERARLRRREAS
jgi:hypothetical protein